MKLIAKYIAYRAGTKPIISKIVRCLVLLSFPLPFMLTSHEHNKITLLQVCKSYYIPYKIQHFFLPVLVAIVCLTLRENLQHRLHELPFY